MPAAKKSTAAKRAPASKVAKPAAPARKSGSPKSTVPNRTGDDDDGRGGEVIRRQGLSTG